MAANDTLAEFPDRQTIRFVRHYPHSVQEIWQALTVPSVLAKWYMPVEMELRLGGHLAFGAGDHFTGRISALEECSVIEFESERGFSHYARGAKLRFVLSHDDSGCWLTFTHTLSRDAVWHGPADAPDCDQPGGPGTPWPGMLAGWHHYVGDRLTSVLAGRAPDEEAYRVTWREWIPVYREHLLLCFGQTTTTGES